MVYKLLCSQFDTNLTSFAWAISWFLWSIFCKIKIRSRYLNFPRHISAIVETHFIPTLCFYLILTDLWTKRKRLIRHRHLIIALKTNFFQKLLSILLNVTESNFFEKLSHIDFIYITFALKYGLWNFKKWHFLILFKFIFSLKNQIIQFSI